MSTTRHPLHTKNRIAKAQRLADAIETNPITRNLDVFTLTEMGVDGWNAVNDLAGEERHPSTETIAMTIGIIAGRRA
jgi:hypothetical protein